MKQQALLNQKRAADFNISSWVVASAGSGKTKILTDRVLNLLLQGTLPEKILCLTFTKAAAKEMIERISDILIEWVEIDDEKLEKSLAKLHPDFEKLIKEKKSGYKKLMQKARRLFAEIMEISGGMKIMTIHGFCQSVLKRFPLEAKVSPYFEVIDENLNQQILEKSYNQVIEASKNNENLDIITNFVNEDDFIKAIKTILSDKDNISKKIVEEKLKKLLNIEILDKEKLAEDFKKNNKNELKNLIIELEKKKKSKTAPVAIEGISSFLSGDLNIDDFFLIFITKDKTIRKNMIEMEISLKVLDLYETFINIDIYNCTLAFITIAFEIISIYEGYKYKDCLLDYDDLITKTSLLLANREIAPWVLYKLDGGIDHILVDEAQDTSPKQWSIIKALTEEIFSGSGVKEDNNRTLFVVGDRKQSIYSFQGANIETFDESRKYFEQKIKDSSNKFEEIPINISFRSTPEILNFVDMVFKEDTARNGVLLPDENLVHIPYFDESMGKVEVWPLCEYPKKDEKTEKEKPDWIIPERKSQELSTKEELAYKIAIKIDSLLKNKYISTSKKEHGKYRKLQPKDIMILVRQRKNDFASEVIRNLKILNIPVAGIDRLKLLEHIAVEDLISLGKFLLFPDDNLSLAEVLKSPLIGINEDDLLNLAYNRGNKSLWQKVKETNHKSFEFFNDLLQKTDFITPFELYTYVLSIKKGRENFQSRMGTEVLDALDEFLNLVKNYCDNNIPSLQNFINFIENDDVEIKREQDDSNVVRLMTIHGSKGLQSPIVFLPDTTGMSNITPKILWSENVPLWIPSTGLASNQLKQMIEEKKEKDKEEYRRLLYVGMTRASEELYISGYGHKNNPKAGNWYELVKSAIENPLNNDKFIKDEEKLILQFRPPNILEKISKEEQRKSLVDVEGWMKTKAPVDDILKPISPSHIDENEIIANSPLSQNQGGFLRGLLVHKILQYLPVIEQSKWQDYIFRYLNRYGKEISERTKESIINNFDKLSKNQEFVSIIRTPGQSEVPICAVIENNIINGQIDKLIINSEEIIIIDYKSNSVVPKSAKEIPQAYKKQMLSYKKVMEKIYPTHNIKSYILWMENIILMEI